ncbi:MAG TPA: hypothetical protein VGN81_32505 [Pseudonocardiaceae bacterium]
MRTILLENVFTVGATPEAVRAHLAEPTNYIGLSPLIVAVDDVRTVNDTVHYVAVERFRFGFLRHDNRIAVSLRTAEGRVWGEVVSPGRVRLDYGYTFVPDGDQTTVTDTLRLRAPFGLRRFAASQARAVQLTRAGILATRMGHVSGS